LPIQSGVSDADGSDGADGADGTNGTNGTDGLDGNTWYSGAIDPDVGTGVDGDFFINETSNEYFKKETGSWVSKGSIKGADGLDGTLSGLLGTDLDCNGFQILESSYPQAPNQSTGIIDYGLGDLVEITATGDLTLSYTNFVAGNVCAMIVDVVNFGDHSITHVAGTLFDSATAPTFTAGGNDRILITKDASDVYSLTVIAQAVAGV